MPKIDDISKKSLSFQTFFFELPADETSSLSTEMSSNETSSSAAELIEIVPPLFSSFSRIKAEIVERFVFRELFFGGTFGRFFSEPGK